MKSPVTVLLVEDDRIEYLLITKSFQRLGAPVSIVWAQDGVEALEIMRGTDARPPLPRPYVVLLDLNLPRLSGLEFLAEVRADARLSDTVVFVQTTSLSEQDRAEAFRHHVAGYLRKTPDPDDSHRIFAMLGTYVELATLPE